MSASVTLYCWLVAAVAGERGFELVLSRRNLRWAAQKGGVERGAGHYRWMVLSHTGLLLACPLEVWLLERPFLFVVGVPALVLLVVSMSLRYWAVVSLGRRWNTRVVVLPGVPVVTSGPYRFLRHPNYLAVVLEVAALPLVHSAWVTAVVFTILNGLILRTRLRVEESTLRELADYTTAMKGRSSLLPGAG